MTKVLMFFAILIAFPVAALGQSIAITGGKVVTNTQAGILENGTVIIKDSRIVAVGAEGTVSIPDGANIVDATGKWVTPGLFVAYSRAGLVEISLEQSTNDTRAEKSEFSAALLAKDSFNPKSENIANTRIEGITRMAILPRASSTIYGGRGALADTSGGFRSISISPAFMFVEMSRSGANIAGGSRSAAWTWLRQSILEAKSWRRGREPAEPLLSAADALAVQAALANDLPFLVHVERASDIINLIDFKQEFRGLNVVAVGATEGWMVKEELRAADIAVIVDPHDNLPQSFETLGATMHNAKRLANAGVKVAIVDLHDEAFNARLAPQHAGNTLATGLDWNTAFAAISKIPAEIFGVDDELGSLAKGMIADVVIWDGDPLELMASPDAIYIDGQAQDMTSRQTRLRDRYMQKSNASLPYAYQ